MQPASSTKKLSSETSNVYLVHKSTPDLYVILCVNRVFVQDVGQEILLARESGFEELGILIAFRPTDRFHCLRFASGEVVSRVPC